MVEQKDFRTRFAATKERKIREACRRKKLWLRIKHGLRHDFSTDDTFTEVYLLTSAGGTGIHFFSITETGRENPETMVVENKRLINNKLKNQIRQFVKIHYPELGNTKVNFLHPKQLQNRT